MRDQIRSTCNSLLRIEQPSAYSKSAWLPAAFWFSTLHRGTRSDLPMGLFFIVAGACTAMPLRPSLGRRITLTDEQLAAYDRDGVVLVKGVLTGRKLQRAQAAAHRVIPSNIPSKARRTSIAQGSSHSHNPTAPQPHSPTAPQTHRPTAPQPHSPTATTAQPPAPLLNHHCRHYSGLVLQGWRSNGVLRSVACDSTVPDLVAQVMRLRADERLRVLKVPLLPC